MIFSEFQYLRLSLLGLGCMRLPTMGSSKDIDVEQVNRMVDTAIESGINYFDTAWTYHKSMSEVVIGRSLSRYPRDSWNLATKFPGHQYFSSYDAKSIFEKQLKKCGVEYFDFYLLHNVSEGSIATYEDPKWGIIDYLVEQKNAGRIRHLGFSTHGRLECIQTFVARHKNEDGILPNPA